MRTPLSMIGSDVIVLSHSMCFQLSEGSINDATYSDRPELDDPCTPPRFVFTVKLANLFDSIKAMRNKDDTN